MRRPSLSTTTVVLIVAVVVIIIIVTIFPSNNVLRFDVSDSRRFSDTDDFAVVIYNRIPKTASTSLMHIPYTLCQANAYHVLLVNLTGTPPHTLSLPDQVNFVRNVTRWTQRLPAIYHGHFGFINFDRLGAFPSRGPVYYINMIRRPLDRLVSYYYFLRYGDDFRVNKTRSRQGDTVSFDECVLQKLPDCEPRKLWLQVPWFCGHFKACWEPGNKWALDQAKFNLVNKYFLVGVTEEIDSFIDALETSLPRFFKGAGELFRNSGKAKHIRRTKYKELPSKETLATIKKSKIWKMEHEFYEFALVHFRSVKRDLLSQTGIRKPSFHYEKIRPLF